MTIKRIDLTLHQVATLHKISDIVKSLDALDVTAAFPDARGNTAAQELTTIMLALDRVMRALTSDPTPISDLEYVSLEPATDNL